MNKSCLSHQVEKSEEQRKKQRQRNILVLISEHLRTNGYLNAASQLEAEAGPWINSFEVCDNVNLETILQDFETYYYTRYRSHIQLVKKTAAVTERVVLQPRKGKTIKSKLPLSVSPHSPLDIREESDLRSGDRLCLLQPLGPYSGLDLNNDWRILAEAVCKEVLVEKPNIAWDDVIGHESAKKCLKEALVYPLKYPDLYDIVKPWRGLLLYGPTGTGKTMLAKAAASESEATFFNVTPATFTSKWRGESEKLLKVLFDLAAAHAPSVIFFDEADSLMAERLSHEHEASRRFKSELLSQMEGLVNLKKSVFILAASNFPWDIDLALLRRMEQRIYVPLPNTEDRIAMLNCFLPLKIKSETVCIETALDYSEIANQTQGFTGADLQLLSKEIKMQWVRKVIDHLESSSKNSSFESVTVPPIVTADVLKALVEISPICRSMEKQYKDFNSSLGTSLV